MSSLRAFALTTLLPLVSAWGKKAAAKPKPKSLIQKLLPLLGLLVALSILGFVGYVILQVLQSISGNVTKKLDEKNIKLSATGAEVGNQGDGKGMTYEEYQDKTQKAVVGLWNNSEMKGFQSRILGVKDGKKEEKKKKSK